MSKEIIKYNNDVNLMDISIFTSRELDLLITCFWYLKENKNYKATITFDEFREKLKLSRLDRTEDYVVKFAKKLKGIVEEYQFIDENEHKVVLIGNLFRTIRIDETDEIMELKIDEDFKHLFNNLLDNYTRFELEEFVSIKRKYSKMLYKLLKQYKSTGYYKIELDEFIRLFGVPDSYKTYHITPKIIEPSIEELKDIFINLRCNKIKKRKVITHLEFLFEPQNKHGEYLYNFRS